MRSRSEEAEDVKTAKHAALVLLAIQKVTARSMPHPVVRPRCTGPPDQ